MPFVHPHEAHHPNHPLLVVHQMKGAQVTLKALTVVARVIGKTLVDWHSIFREPIELPLEKVQLEHHVNPVHLYYFW